MTLDTQADTGTKRQPLYLLSSPRAVTHRRPFNLMLNTAKLAARADRAHSALVFRCVYKLGRGGFNPSFPKNPSWDAARSDCSGFVSWVLMTRRSPKPGRKIWIETTMIYGDAKNDNETFRQIKIPVAGCLVVYPDRQPKFLQPKREGHIGVVVNVRDSGGQFDTIECASGPLGRIGRAIRTRKDAKDFWASRNAIFVVLKEDFTNP